MIAEYFKYKLKHQYIAFVVVLILSATTSAQMNQLETPSHAPGRETYKQVQLQTIFISFVDFYHYGSLKEVQDQVYGIPGVTDFIPYQETKGLMTYDLRYSGSGDLLQKALQETLGTRFEIGVKQNDKDLWEFTIRKLQ